jgi:hypothetical protein
VEQGMMKKARLAWPMMIGMLLLAGCQGVPGADGRYATPGRGGWDSFRAEAPAPGDGPSSQGGRENFRADATPPGGGPVQAR